MIPLFKVHKPTHVETKIKAVLDGGYWAEGESVRLFEKYLQEFFDNQYTLTTNSCTSALHLSLIVAGVKKDTYVMTTPMTCIASTVSITNLCATPIWVDVDPIHGMLTANSIRTTWTKMTHEQRRNTKALIYVCWGGDLGRVDEVDAICKEFGIKLIIDAAQAFGTAYEANILGDCKHGDFVCFSFQAIKHISTGDGGAMTCRKEDDFLRASKLKWFGIDRDGFRTPTGEINWSSDIPEIGYKFHMNNIAGAIGVAHMEELEETDCTRLKMYCNNDELLTKYLEHTSNEKGKDFSLAQRTWKGPSSSWVATFLVENPLRLLSFLKDNYDINTSQMHINNDVYTGFSGAVRVSDLKGTKEFMAHHLCLPCGPWLTLDDIKNMALYISKEK